ncbi:MAG: HupE/UreJ family protein [Gammaproteobacteria bacterium]|jgi:urease accessory protein|nr:urease accessory protein UreJ [Gammaproteobacteria bacterium]MDP6146670.1 HupE/UreJ family protein [Gammaproteobacteria bacterium]HJL79607.1 HupE/UreJ family protein [Gammaproteobacteria bacterium]HJM09114.1 HupE/UreJ family protein [Gammaproteobacteria bacterium]HJN01239.1 HupE/UreJ family protein [Gammaproteobacteria bacterium]|tara:strand:- start:19858 stop:20442 length:585 start_codon:yes stop_codon:yes gene_type:complete
MMIKTLILFLLFFSSVLSAHEAQSLPYGPFLSGITHPVLGFDHLLAMVSVGMISAQIGGRAIWTVPATFVIVMFFGGILGLNYSGLTGYEIGIALSVLLLGSTLAADKKIDANFAMLAVAIFAIFHGYAHGEEIPSIAEPPPYVTGFMTGTVILHVTGVVIADISTHYEKGKILLRLLGGLIALSGLYFLIGAL